MMNEKKKLALGIVLISVITSMLFSISTTFIVLLVGLLFVPPAIVLMSIAMEGVRINEKLNKIAESDENHPVIFVAK